MDTRELIELLRGERVRGSDGWIAHRYCMLAADALSSQAAEIERLREALEWYGEQARMSSGGDAGHAALEKDGGKRARAALAPKPNRESK